MNTMELQRYTLERKRAHYYRQYFLALRRRDTTLAKQLLALARAAAAELRAGQSAGTHAPQNHV